MVDVSQIAGMVSALKAATDMTKAMVGLRDQTVIADRVVDLQRIIMDAQSGAMQAQLQIMELADQLRQAKARIDEDEAWKAVAARYKLADYGGNTFAYELRQELAQEEPHHRICPTCFERRKRSILQFRHKGADRQDLYRCVACETDFWFGLAQPLPRRNNEQWSGF
ncbi:hypothetical protein D3218_19140 [Aureimonas flava]|uniref:Uncharacterized protein n=1 Tax=Aureimonas flava TaxID=2320271 RepID=A0A3A1WF81_9HYPH|nr:hypothetical protein [Aureimonas flava]RIX97177.1 hypothetical protein D3218_19140 [Aureimonas flava]